MAAKRFWRSHQMTTLLRHIIISEKFAPIMKEQVKLANVMGHSLRASFLRVVVSTPRPFRCFSPAPHPAAPSRVAPPAASTETVTRDYHVKSSAYVLLKCCLILV
jgi:hypothetical protein